MVKASFGPRIRGTAKSFSYDNLNQLQSANGTFLPGNNRQQRQERYSLGMQYDSISNLTNKEQSHEASLFANHWQTQAGSSYDYGYQYDSGKPHEPSQIGQRNYQHDANGNQTGWELPTGILDLIQERRVLEWDEENRLKNVANNTFGLLSDEYVYDHAGERTIKREGVSVVSYLNAHATINSASQLTKHIYAGSQRIVTKVAGEVTQTLIDPATGLNGYQSSYGGFSNPDVFYRNFYQEERQRYFYHPDHLGSTSYVTDASGVISEHVAYFPTGETWSEQSGFGFSVPYKFTSKELDASTGLYYHGARYYDPRTSVWQSADPILDEYLAGGPNGGVFTPVNMQLYGYSWNNPANYTDPDGRSTFVDSDGGVTGVRLDNDLGIYQAEVTDNQCAIVKVGETLFEDAFIQYDNSGNVTRNPDGTFFLERGKVNFGESIDSQISRLYKSAKVWSSVAVGLESRSEGAYDIKTKIPGRGPYDALQLEGKYVTLREAGNILAGMNAASHRQSFDEFQRTAGGGGFIKLV